MASPRRPELSRLNVFFCLLVVWIHVVSQAVSALDKLSWQYALVLVSQRLAFVSVPGFFLLSGVKLTLPKKKPQTLARYWTGRVRNILIPYVFASLAYYLVFTCLLHWFSFSVGDFFGYLIRGDLSAQFYFLIALAQFILLAPFFRTLSANYSPCFLLPVALGITWLSSLYFNELLQLFFPSASFAYADRIFTSYLVYYLAGCCIGQNYEYFLKLLKENRKLILSLAIFFAIADSFVSIMNFSGRRYTPYAEFVHTLYILCAIPALFEYVTRIQRPLPHVGILLDRSSYLIYLYHCLVIVLFDHISSRLGLQRVSVLLAGRFITVYLLTPSLCILWQRFNQKFLKMIQKKEPLSQ